MSHTFSMTCYSGSLGFQKQLVVTGLGRAAAASSGDQETHHTHHQQWQLGKWKISLHRSHSIEQQIEICAENIILHPFWENKTEFER